MKCRSPRSLVFVTRQVGARLGQRSAPAWMSSPDRRCSPLSVVSSSTSRLTVVDEVQPPPSPVDHFPSVQHASRSPPGHASALHADQSSYVPRSVRELRIISTYGINCYELVGDFWATARTLVQKSRVAMTSFIGPPNQKSSWLRQWFCVVDSALVLIGKFNTLGEVTSQNL